MYCTINCLPSALINSVSNVCWIKIPSSSSSKNLQEKHKLVHHYLYGEDLTVLQYAWLPQSRSQDTTKVILSLTFAVLPVLQCLWWWMTCLGFYDFHLKPAFHQTFKYGTPHKEDKRPFWSSQRLFLQVNGPWFIRYLQNYCYRLFTSCWPGTAVCQKLLTLIYGTVVHKLS